MRRPCTHRPLKLAPHQAFRHPEPHEDAAVLAVLSDYVARVRDYRPGYPAAQVLDELVYVRDLLSCRCGLELYLHMPRSAEHPEHLYLALPWQPDFPRPAAAAPGAGVAPEAPA